MKFVVQNSSSSSYCAEENKACARWVEMYFKDCLCNVRDELSFALGLISLVCWGVAEIPQIITNFRTKSAHGVSLMLILTWIVGDVFNFVGCLLEPATLPTQFYTAVFYTISAMILVMQSLYYGYLNPKAQHCQETESEVEEVKISLIPRKPIDSAIPIPNGTTATREVHSYMSARSMTESTTPPAWSYPWPVKDDTSSKETNRMPAKKCISKPRPIPLCVGFAAFIASLLNKPNVTLALMKVHRRSTGRKLLQEHGIETDYGQWLGWMMAAIYMGGRIPQIWLNIKRGTVEGLNPLMFVLAVAANATYVASILVRSTAWDTIQSNMPWLMDAVGCMALDVFIVLQYLYYRCLRKRSCSREEHGCYIEADMD